MVAFVWRDDGTDAAVLDAERPNVHDLTAHAHAAITKDAARAVKVNDRRPLLLVLVRLGLHVLRFGSAVGEGHVLQFALAASVTDRTVKGMIAEQKLDGGFARLLYLVTLIGDDHAVSDRHGAGGLQLGHLLDADDAHAARGLKRKSGIVAE